jgi:hypothetical protein
MTASDDIRLPVEAPERAPVASTTPDRLIALAIEHGADVDRLGKLMDLQDRWKAQQAREAYFEALARFQHTLPPIPRDKEVKNRDGSLRYAYASLDCILRHIREPMYACGLSWVWSPGVPTDEGVATTCTITHVLGHAESSSVTIPGITSGGTNAAQDAGGANTYGRRYSMINVLGIQATDDTDAEGIKTGPIDALLRQMDLLRIPEILQAVYTCKVNFVDGADLSAAAEAYAEFTREDIAALWVAPTKGGIWTVEERKRIKSDPEFHAMVQKHREDFGWHERNPG